MTKTVRLGAFSPSVLLEVARQVGALDDAGLDVEEVPARSSPGQFAELVDGTLDAALTSPDNVVAYRYVPGNPLGATHDVRVLAAIDRGLGLSLFRAPGCAPDRVRGGLLLVDVPVSGFAFVAFELLAREGLGGDYAVESAGATPWRAAALIADECATTVLNAGSDLRAEVAGAHRVARATSIGPYLGTVLAAHGRAVESDDGRLAALTRVLVTVSARLAAGELRGVAAEAARRRLDLDAATADRYVDTLVDPAEGVVPDGRVDPAALTTLLTLRNRHSPGPAIGTEGSLAGPSIDTAGSLASPSIDTDTVLDGGYLDERFLPSTFRVNGRPAAGPADGTTPLLYVLRNDLGLLGTRFGCGAGDCGACLVLVDGRPVTSCDLPVDAVAGKEVGTVEGLAPHPLQEEFLAGQAAQCGYCVSGILVNAAALLSERPRPTEAQVRDRLDRNLCRCGAHNRMVAAVLRAAERRAVR